MSDFPKRLPTANPFESADAIRSEWDAALETIAETRRAEQREADAQKERRALLETSAVTYLENKFNQINQEDN